MIDHEAKFCRGRTTVCSLEFTPGINWFQTTISSAYGHRETERLEVRRQVPIKQPFLPLPCANPNTAEALLQPDHRLAS